LRHLAWRRRQAFQLHVANDEVALIRVRSKR
jgi:hypothetical protein